jgi:cell division protein FtsI/penicillin-binding protein 2
LTEGGGGLVDRARGRGDVTDEGLRTGTAEFGSAAPPQTHAWLVGWQGDVAFAAFVEEGKSGGSVAAPLARDFLARLHRG